MDAKIAEVEAYMEDAREELLSLKDSIWVYWTLILM